ncbi:MAG: hypothetical protein ACP5NE_01745 [Candidatus Micrarchaeia archaeon]
MFEHIGKEFGANNVYGELFIGVVSSGMVLFLAYFVGFAIGVGIPRLGMLVSLMFSGFLFSFAVAHRQKAMITRIDAASMIVSLLFSLIIIAVLG